MNCLESLEGPLDTLHTPDKQRFWNYMRVGLFTGRDEGIKDVIFGSPFGQWDDTEADWDHHFKKFLVFVTSYTSRNLTFDSDSIHAFTRILKQMESCNSYMGHLLGIPYVSPVPFTPLQSTSLDCVIAGLCWSHLGSCWSNSGQQPRRGDAFLSWSWASWAGAVSWTDLFTHDDMDIRSLVDSFRCELGNGAILSLSEYSELRLIHDCEPPDVVALRFAAWLCPPDMLTLIERPAEPHWGIAGYKWELHLSLFGGSPREFLHAVKSGSLQCILIGGGLYNSFFLVLEKQGCSARRVGTGEAHWNQYQTRGRVIDNRFADHVKFDFLKTEFRLI